MFIVGFIIFSLYMIGLFYMINWGHKSQEKEEAVATRLLERLHEGERLLPMVGVRHDCLLRTARGLAALL